MTALDGARRAYAAYLLGDKAGLVPYVHPDARWVFPGDPALLPWAGTYTGVGITRFLDLVADHLDYLEVRDEGWWTAGERVFVLAFERFRVRATGRICDNRYVSVFTMEGGRVRAYEEFGDTAAMAAAFR